MKKFDGLTIISTSISEEFKLEEIYLPRPMIDEYDCTKIIKTILIGLAIFLALVVAILVVYLVYKCKNKLYRTNINIFSELLLKG